MLQLRWFAYALLWALLALGCSGSASYQDGGGGDRDGSSEAGPRDGALDVPGDGPTNDGPGVDKGLPPCSTKTFSVVADATVDEGSPDSNFGSDNELLTDSGSTDQHAYLRFSLSGITAPVTKATLRLYVTNRSNDGPKIHTASGAWAESTITWNNKPAASASPIIDLGAISSGGYIDIDVTSAVSKDGDITFVAIPTSSDGADFSSREGANAAQLVVACGGGPPTDGGMPDSTRDGPVPDGGPPPPGNVVRGPYLQNGSPSAVTVRWRTTGCASSRAPSRVRYGTAVSALSQSAQATSTCYNGDTEHEVRVTGLSAKTTYYYAIGTTAGDLTQPHVDYHFITSPTPGSTGAIRMWVLGDSGTANSNARAVRDAYLQLAAAERPADMWLMLGDNAYNDGTDSQYQAAVFETYPTVLRNRVLWSTRGNHDDHSGNNYFGVFTLPTQAEGGGLASGTESYYSFDYGNVHLVCLNSNSSENRSPSGAMLTWLKQDLAATTRTWVIAFWHHPPYSRGSHNDNSTARDNFLPIVEAGGVDVVLSGHSHAYERSFLIDGVYGTSTPSSSNIIDQGDGKPSGNGAYSKPAGLSANKGAVYVVAGSSGKTSGGSLDHPVMKVSFNNLGSMVIDVTGNRLDARFLRETGQVTDNFTIIKGP